jgi:hypothetical protein
VPRCHAADVTDREDAGLSIDGSHRLFRWLRHLSPTAYSGPKLRDALAKFGNWSIEIAMIPVDWTAARENKLKAGIRLLV